MISSSIYRRALYVLNNTLSARQKRNLYNFALFVIKFFSFFFYAKAYARNSFYCDYFRPGVSDLDITIIYQIDNLGNQKNHVQIMKVIQKIFPFVSEINYYDSFYLQHLSKWNQVEFARDRILAPFLKDPMLSEKQLYILKKIERNRTTIEFEIENRKDKWKYYLNLIGLQSNFNAYANLIYYIHRTIMETIGVTYRDTYNFFYGERSNSKILWLVNPFEALHYFNCPPSTLSNKELSVMGSSLYWEISGVLSQYRSHNFESSHLERIRTIAQFLNYTYFFEDTLSHIKSYHDA